MTMPKKVTVKFDMEEFNRKRNEWEASQSSPKPLLSGKAMMNVIIEELSILLQDCNYKVRKSKKHVWIDTNDKIWTFSFQKDRQDQNYECSFKVAIRVSDSVIGKKPDAYSEPPIEFFTNEQGGYWHKIDSWTFDKSFVDLFIQLVKSKAIPWFESQM